MPGDAAVKGYLFVYGTLLSALQHPMGKRLQSSAHLLGVGSVRGKLYDLGRYPGLIVSGDETSQVYGEVYEFCENSSLLRELDAYEGYYSANSPKNLYDRCKVAANLNSDNAINVWTYIYLGQVIGNGYIAHGNYLAYIRTHQKRSMVF